MLPTPPQRVVGFGGSVSNPTESATVYTLEELGALGAACRAAGTPPQC
jgi:hypothetical protein